MSTVLTCTSKGKVSLGYACLVWAKGERAPEDRMPMRRTRGAGRASVYLPTSSAGPGHMVLTGTPNRHLRVSSRREVLGRSADLEF
jgi:hypothetical protein